jgi:hypothetical protein
VEHTAGLMLEMGKPQRTETQLGLCMLIVCVCFLRQCNESNQVNGMRLATLEQLDPSPWRKGAAN